MTSTKSLPQVPALPFAVFDEFGQGADDRVRDYAAALVAAERERWAPLVRAAGRALQAFDDGDLQPAPDTVQGRLAVDALRKAWGAFVPSRIRSPQHPAPAEPAPLWAPEGLVAHDDDPGSDRCLKCCLDGSRQCFKVPCLGVDVNVPIKAIHPSGRPVYFTRKP